MLHKSLMIRLSYFSVQNSRHNGSPLFLMIDLKHTFTLNFHKPLKNFRISPTENISLHSVALSQFSQLLQLKYQITVTHIQHSNEG